MSTREAQEWSAKDNYSVHKREYVDACVSLAEALLEHGDLAHPEIVARREACRLAKLIKDDAWRVLARVIGK